MNSTIILIGPLGAGKTTVGQLLAKQLGVPFCSVDTVRPAYYQKVGYHPTAAASGDGVRDVMRATGLDDYIGAACFFNNEDAALDAIGQAIGEEAVQPFRIQPTAKKYA